MAGKTAIEKPRGDRKRPRRKKKGTPGPRTLCTPKLIAKMAGHIEKGSSIEATCGAEGIDAKSLRDWRAKSEKGIEPYASILPTLKRALVVAVRNAEQRIAAGPLRWESSARWLESMRPERWRRTERREVAHTHDVRFSWPDLAKPGKTVAGQRAAAVEKALRKTGRN